MNAAQVRINNDLLGSYRDDREFDISLRMQRRLIISGYSAEDSQRGPRARNQSDNFINNAF